MYNFVFCNAPLLIYYLAWPLVFPFSWWCLWVQSCFSLCGVANEWLNVISRRATQSNGRLFMCHWLFTADSKGDFPGNGVVSVLSIIWMFHFRSLNTCPAYYMLPWIAYVGISQSGSHQSFLRSHQVYLMLILATLQSNTFQITPPIKLCSQDVVFKLGLHMDYAEHVLWVRALNMNSMVKWWPHLPLVSSIDCGNKIRTVPTSCEVTRSRKCTINVPTNWHNKYALRTGSFVTVTQACVTMCSVGSTGSFSSVLPWRKGQQRQDSCGWSRAATAEPFVLTRPWAHSDTLVEPTH